MKTKKFSRFLCLLVTMVMVFTMLPKMSITAYAEAEQFTLPIGQTYYFDLSGEVGTITNGESNKIGKINTAVPDVSLHYVPFTYVGTVNAYSLDSSSSGVLGASAAATPSNRSLFVSDYLISHTVCWDDLNKASVIFGKNFNTNYTLRSLSMGSNSINTDAQMKGTPSANEWDSILNKLPDGIKNWNGNYSLGQDTVTTAKNLRAIRGNRFVGNWSNFSMSNFAENYGWRPALEVQNPATLTSNGLKTIALNLSGGHLGTDISVTSMNIVYTGNNYIPPNATNLTPPAGSTDTNFKWNTQANGKGTSYAVGANVPNTVTTLYAQWKSPPPATLGVSYDIVGGTGTGSRLESSLDVVVTNNTEGITNADKASGNNVSLKLTVAEKATANTLDTEKIEGVKQGDTVQYYDVKVEKTVTPSGGSATTTTLTGIPKPVRAIIPVPQAIQGKTSYTVYRIHNNAVDKISNDPTAPEYYTVNKDGTSLTLNVSKFSTYALITGNKSLTGDATFGDAINPKTSDMDVQGKILEGAFGVYKLDVSWGAMKFDYNSKGAVWNPDTHGYIPGSGTKGWTNESFEANNNKIAVANHSNGDVLLSYVAKPDALLDGTTMTVRTTNSLSGDLAANVLLAKVQTEGGAVPAIDTYVWLTGEPISLAGLNDKTYTKAGVITITAEADLTSGLTPKTTTP